VVKPEDQAEAHELFDDLGIAVESGQRFLGSFIGDHEGIQEFVEQKVQEWVHCVEKLTKASESQPQAAQMALTKSLQFKWSLIVLMPLHHCGTPFARNLTPLHTKLPGKKFKCNREPSVWGPGGSTISP